MQWQRERKQPEWDKEFADENGDQTMRSIIMITCQRKESRKFDYDDF
jgi:hypothetical protein